MYNFLSSVWNFLAARYDHMSNTNALHRVSAELKFQSDIMFDKKLDASLKYAHLEVIEKLVDRAIEYIKIGANVNEPVSIGYSDYRYHSVNTDPEPSSLDKRLSEKDWIHVNSPRYIQVPKILWLSLDRKIYLPEWDEISSRYNSAMKKLCDAILDYGKPNLKEQYNGMNLISKVVCNGDADALQKIVHKRFVDFNEKDYQGAVPLQYAFSCYTNGVKGAKECVELLLAYGASPHKQWMGAKPGTSIADYIKSNYAGIYNEFFEQDASVIDAQMDANEPLVAEMVKTASDSDA